MWFRRKKIADDLKTVTEVAGDQIAPGAGTLILVLGAAAIAGAGAYYVSRTRKKKAAGNPAASSKSDPAD
ncbi:MAG TPA: hypothetical protein VGC16_09320 [Rhizomicrobium sp.]